MLKAVATFSDPGTPAGLENSYASLPPCPTRRCATDRFQQGPYAQNIGC